MDYTVKKDGAMWLVLNQRGVIVFRSLRRITCCEWVKANTEEQND